MFSCVFYLFNLESIIIVIPCSGLSGVSEMCEQHLGLLRALELPLVLVVTKTDLATPSQLGVALEDVKSVLTKQGQKRVRIFFFEVFFNVFFFGDQERPDHPLAVGGGVGGRQECVYEAGTEEGERFF